MSQVGGTAMYKSIQRQNTIIPFARNHPARSYICFITSGHPSINNTDTIDISPTL